MENCTHIFPAKNLAMVKAASPKVAASMNWASGCDHIKYGWRYIYNLLPPDDISMRDGGYSYTAAETWSAAQINACD